MVIRHRFFIEHLGKMIFGLVLIVGANSNLVFAAPPDINTNPEFRNAVEEALSNAQNTLKFNEKTYVINVHNHVHPGVFRPGFSGTKYTFETASNGNGGESTRFRAFYGQQTSPWVWFTLVDLPAAPGEGCSTITNPILNEGKILQVASLLKELVHASTISHPDYPKIAQITQRIQHMEIFREQLIFGTYGGNAGAFNQALDKLKAAENVLKKHLIMPDITLSMKLEYLREKGGISEQQALEAMEQLGL